MANVADGTVAAGTGSGSFDADQFFLLGTLQQAENQCDRSWRKKLAASNPMLVNSRGLLPVLADADTCCKQYRRSNDRPAKLGQHPSAAIAV